MNPSKPESGCIRLGALLNGLPGEKYKGIRNPPRSLLLRIQEKLNRQLYPEHAEAVRGIGVAGDNLLFALLRNSTKVRFAFFLEPGQPTGASAKGVLRDRGLNPDIIDVSSRTALLSGDFGTTDQPDVWLDIYGTAVESFSLRNHFASRVYPIMSLQHAFSAHTLLYERFLRLSLIRGYGCDSIVCTSRAGRQGLEKVFGHLSETLERDTGICARFRGRFDTIPLCVDTDRYCPGDKVESRKSLRLPRDATILVYVGYVAPMKADLLPLLATVQRLASSNPRHKLLLLLVGAGWNLYRELLLRRARDFNIERQVIVLSDVTDERKLMALQAADIFVSPSDTPQEQFGLAPIEAMACGIPQVVSDWNGYRDTVRHGQTGFLIPTYWTDCDGELTGTGDLLGWRYDHMVLSQSLAIDTPELFRSLQDLIRNKDLRCQMALKSRDIAIREFSYEAVARQYESLWADLVEQAALCGPLCPAPRFDQPSYFSILGHYATHQLADHHSVSMSGPVPPLTWRDLQAANGWGRPVLDEVLLNSILDCVRGAAARGTPTLSVGALVSTVTGEGRRLQPVRRHILWLIKYGILTYHAAGDPHLSGI